MTHPPSPATVQALARMSTGLEANEINLSLEFEYRQRCFCEASILVGAGGQPHLPLGGAAAPRAWPELHMSQLLIPDFAEDR
jgi:hypothetical protein